MAKRLCEILVSSVLAFKLLLPVNANAFPPLNTWLDNHRAYKSLEYRSDPKKVSDHNFVYGTIAEQSFENGGILYRINGVLNFDYMILFKNNDLFRAELFKGNEIYKAEGNINFDGDEDILGNLQINSIDGNLGKEGLGKEGLVAIAGVMQLLHVRENK